MSADVQNLADPILILLGWAAGLSLAAGVISLRQVVGPGFTWITAGFAATVGLGGWAAEGAVWSKMALGLVVLALVWARNRPLTGVLLVLAGTGYALDAALLGAWLPALSLTAALGGVTSEMALAHWYLVDPRLPRSVLRGLAIAGIAGLIADGLVLAYLGDFATWSGSVIALTALFVTSVVLMVGVIGALAWPAYSGVMAATGLSYLALLTTLGAVFLGRALVAGVGPFAS
ncbi:MAG TPA: hypothetical protein VF246_05720 [Acidimicrobiia bacterium]